MGVKIVRGDLVVVISGDDKELDKSSPTPRRVLRVLPQKGKVVVEGVNLVWKHVRRSQKHPRGGRIQKEMPVDISNVMLWCDNCHRPVRVRMGYDESGQKQRYCKRCGNLIPKRK